MEIKAKIPGGTPDKVVRIVTENGPLFIQVKRANQEFVMFRLLRCSLSSAVSAFVTISAPISSNSFSSISSITGSIFVHAWRPAVVLRMALKDSDQFLLSSGTNDCGGSAGGDTYSVNAAQQENISYCSSITKLLDSFMEAMILLKSSSVMVGRKQISSAPYNR